MGVVCVDTQILCWAIIDNGTQNSSLTSHAIGFMRWLEKEKESIIIPTIVVGELLIPVPPSDRPRVLSQFQSDWMIVDYDLRAAAKFAELRYDHIFAKRYKELRALNPGTTRKELNADVMILAAAIAHGASVLYSHDTKLLKLAQGYIDAINFLDVPVQPSLLGD